MIKPLKNNIIFQFLDETDTSHGKFKQISASGFEIISSDTTDSTEKPRWAKIVALGEDVTEVVEGDYVCISPLMWTDHVTYEKAKYWKTDIDNLLLVSKDIPDISL